QTLAGAFALAGVYAAVLRTGKRLDALAVTQIIFDQATWTVLVYLTGGASSGATSFYGITCLIGAFLIGVRGATLAGTTGIVLYTFLSVALQFGLVVPPRDQP